VWRTRELRIFTLHKRFHHARIGVYLGRHNVFVHVLQLRKVVQNVEEYIVQKGVVLDVMVKRWIFWFHCVGETLLVVKKVTCPSNRESEMVNKCNIAYDIVRQHTMLYVSIRCRMSAYDAVRQHTMSYVSIRCRMSAYDVVRQDTMSYVGIRCRTSACDVVHQHTMSNVSIRCRTSAYDVAYDMQYVGDNIRGSGDLTKKSVQAFLARLLEVSEARSFAATFAILDVLQGFEENVLAWTDRTRDQRAACVCTGRHACVHVARWRCAPGKGAYM
jgi:hypothetical protein